MVTSYLDESYVGIGPVFQAAYAELDIGEVQAMGKLALESLVSRWHRWQCRLAQHMLWEQQPLKRHLLVFS
jgi:hypothetical protein